VRTPALYWAAGSLTTTSPVEVKPTITTRWPAVALIGAPVRPPRAKEIEAMTGMPARMNSSASASERRRVTNAWPVRFAAYAVLNGQFPVPS
jgi:hypothetical protein